MAEGQTAYQRDTGIWYRYESAVWTDVNSEFEETEDWGLIRIYRAVSGINRTDYQFVGEKKAVSMPNARITYLDVAAMDNADGAVDEWAYVIDTDAWYLHNGTVWAVQAWVVGTSTYDDDTEPESLGEVIPTNDWAVPPLHITEIQGMANGVLAAFYQDGLFFSLPYLPYAWPVKYMASTQTPIVGITPILGALVVVTNEYPYYVTGNVPVSFQVQKLDFSEACASKRSLVTIGNTAYYASPNGVAAIQAGSGGLLTTNLIIREDWENFLPESMIGLTFEDDYGLLYDGSVQAGGDSFTLVNSSEPIPSKGMLWVDLQSQDIRIENFSGVNLLLHTKEEDAFEINQVEGIWGMSLLYGSTTNRTMTWRSKKYRFPLFINMGTMVVEADDYPVNIQVYADEILRYTVDVTDGEIWRLPAGYEAKVWEFRIEGDVPVRNVMVGTSVPEVAGI